LPARSSERCALGIGIGQTSVAKYFIGLLLALH
jgi:hypothetical protein